MIEARIECLCVGGFQIDDLGCSLKKGEVLWVPEAKARGSADLKLALQARAVSVRWEERCAVSRQPPPMVKRINKQYVPPPKTVHEPPVQVSVQQQVAPPPEPQPAPAPLQTAEPEALKLVRRRNKKS